MEWSLDGDIEYGKALFETCYLSKPWGTGREDLGYKDTRLWRKWHIPDKGNHTYSGVEHRHRGIGRVSRASILVWLESRICVWQGRVGGWS